MSKRELPPELLKELDVRLHLNGLAQEAKRNLVPRRDAAILFRLAAEACVGVREQGGNNQGPIVRLFQDAVDGPDPWAWCLSFVQACIAYAEVKTGVLSTLPATEHVLTLWRSAEAARLRTTIPALGTIVLWRKGNTDLGHCGVSLGYADHGTFYAVEGNTTYRALESVPVRDGGGVALTERKLTGTPEMSILGFIRPF